ncbi:uracil-DNA glycosylase family protein [Desulfurispirillum indicum]|uniref:uracil-DNA glycosylase family protein n=1 Tax=Desulfurispirillum indicum TaxID=936456 RepID=UPI001CFB0E24|nr:uracil-DNA glycosylase family protein [Desulfurispirillum indicum]UCZ55808.1 uracil-DNA glycosylase family protein [Desulfurispirillum indicum]
MENVNLEALLVDIRRCTLCEPYLPLGARPVVQVHRDASILIAGQAPGRRVHASGIPFDDASGDRLRQWMGVAREIFYDECRIAIVPMGFCYPGTGPHGDLPPRPQCAATWRAALLSLLPHIQLTLVIGKYAQEYHMLPRPDSVTAAVVNWQERWPHLIALPHPSPRNHRWLRQNPWFEAQLLPRLRDRVSVVLQGR